MQELAFARVKAVNSHKIGWKKYGMKDKSCKKPTKSVQQIGRWNRLARVNSVSPYAITIYYYIRKSRTPHTI